MAILETPILLRHIPSGADTQATLRSSIDASNIRDHETHWRLFVIRALLRWHRRGFLTDRWPESIGWNWRRIADPRNYRWPIRCFSIMCRGVTQGLMSLEIGTRSRITPKSRSPLVYIAYVETAPWNIANLAGEARYAGVGRALIRAAVEASLAAGFEGRVGLHALPGAERFYRLGCRMADHGRQREMEGLRYFEFTPARASRFLGKAE
jgi:hypothetical protein